MNKIIVQKTLDFPETYFIVSKIQPFNDIFIQNLNIHIYIFDLFINLTNKIMVYRIGAYYIELEIW